MAGLRKREREAFCASEDKEVLLEGLSEVLGLIDQETWRGGLECGRQQRKHV